MRRATVVRPVVAALVAIGLGACGVAGHRQVAQNNLVEANNGLGQSSNGGGSAQAVPLHGHPQAVNPVAGQSASVSPGGAGAGASQSGEVSVSPPAGGGPLPQPISDAQVRAQLAASGISANPDQATLTPGRLALAPVSAPAPVQAVINAGNEIAHLPYVWGGGHETFQDSGYDCSGSLSFILAAAGLLGTTETSGELMNYGDRGRGKWITIFANQGHTFAYIAGLRFDTVALAETGSRWSNRPADESNLGSFAIRHPPGM